MAREREPARPSWEAWSGERRRRIEAVLERALTGQGNTSAVHAAMRYAVLGGGK